MKNKKLLSLVQLALLAAIVIIFQMMGSFIRITPTTSVSLVLIPIVIGAVLVGPGGGAFLGFLFGAITLWAGISGADGFTHILFTTQPFATALICLGKGTLAGYLAGLLYRLIARSGKTSSAVLGAFVFCIASGAALPQFAIYCLGNLAAMALLPLVKGDGWERLHDQVLLALLYGVLTALAMQLGRGLIALAMGTDPALCAGFITTDALSALFAALIVWITRRLDGMLEEQKHYLTRVAEEMKREQQARMNDPWQEQY